MPSRRRGYTGRRGFGFDVGIRGARVATELLRLLNVERNRPAPEPVSTPQPAPIPAEYVAATAAVDALKAAGL